MQQPLLKDQVAANKTETMSILEGGIGQDWKIGPDTPIMFSVLFERFVLRLSKVKNIPPI